MNRKELMKELKNLHKNENVKFEYAGTKFIIRNCEIDKGLSVEEINIMGYNLECFETPKEVVEFIFGKEE